MGTLRFRLFRLAIPFAKGIPAAWPNAEKAG
jgi:hypothetical protein